MAVTITWLPVDPSVPLADLGAVWGRVSTTEQHEENQIPGLVSWGERRGLTIAAVFGVEDSASREGRARGKGLEFNRARAELIKGAHQARYSKVLVQHSSRLSRYGIEDTLRVIRRLLESGPDTWSMEEPFLDMTDENMRELMLSFVSFKNRGENTTRAKAIKLGIERRRAMGLPVGGRKPGSRNRTPRVLTEAHKAKLRDYWQTPEGMARRAALAERNRSS